MASVIASVSDLRVHLAASRSAGTIGLVPTMGALHAGHERLIAQARLDCDHVVVSVFVNPTQFDRQDDYERYPRDLDADIAACEEHDVDVVFAPTAEEVYRDPMRTTVQVSGLTEHLCGAFRPGHFEGVATIVAKLLHIVQPDRAYFGKKDAQQLAVIRRMVRDLDMPVQIVAGATVRDPDGLALSSRNERLTPEQRRAALVIPRALREVEARVHAGVVDARKLRRAARALFEAQPEVRLEYLEVVDPQELQPVARVEAQVLVAAAAWVGSTRLIDNLEVSP